MGKNIRLFVGVALGAASLVSTATTSPVRALNYPAAFANFPMCAGPTDEFCIDVAQFTPTGGSASSMTSLTDPSVVVNIAGSYAGPSGPGASGFYFPGLSLNFFYQSGTSYDPNNPPGTLDGVPDGVYRVKLRTGDYDPSFAIAVGAVDSYSVVAESDGTFIVDMSLKPKPSAQVAVLPNAPNAITDCEAVKWLAGCEANLTYRRIVRATLLMSTQSDMRTSGRGTWIASNASMAGIGGINPAAGSIDINAKGPHYVPADFGDTSLPTENGRYLNPAFFEMYTSFSMISAMLSQMAGRTVTVDQVKSFLAQPKDVVEGTIEEATSPSAAIQEKLKELTISVDSNGIKVNFNLTHYSAPNPTLKFKMPSSAPSSSGGNSSTTSPKRLSNGATISALKTATKGKSLTTKAILSPSKGASVTKVVSKSTTVCKISGTRVKMLKSGTCKLTATIKLKTKSSTANVSIKVS